MGEGFVLPEKMGICQHQRESTNCGLDMDVILHMEQPAGSEMFKQEELYDMMSGTLTSVPGTHLFLRLRAPGRRPDDRSRPLDFYGSTWKM